MARSSAFVLVTTAALATATTFVARRRAEAQLVKAPPSPSGVEAFNWFHDGSTTLGAQEVQVVATPALLPGNYVIFASAQTSLWHTANAPLPFGGRSSPAAPGNVRCTLAAGGDFDRKEARVDVQVPPLKVRVGLIDYPAVGVEDARTHGVSTPVMTDNDTLSFQVAHVVRQPEPVVLKCAGTGSSEDRISAIKITALKVPQLTGPSPI